MRDVDIVTKNIARIRPFNAVKNRIDALDNEERLPSSTSECHFFKLCPEIRNKIYRFTLHHPDDIWITKDSGIPEASLLLVSKQVRAEAYGIFYHENTFRCVVLHFDPASLLLAARKKDRELEARYPLIGISSSRLVMDFDQRNWANFEAWLRACLRSQCSGLIGHHGDDPETCMIEGLFAIVTSNTGMGDHTLDVLLKAMRSVLVGLHPDWRLDGSPDEDDH